MVQLGYMNSKNKNTAMRKWFLFGVMLVLPLAGYSQGLISFGPKIGWNQTKVSTDYHDYIDDMKNGVQGGLFFSISMGKLYVQPEAYFSVRRGDIALTLGDPMNGMTDINVEQTFTLTTIDIPMLLGYELLDLKLAKLRCWGGPVASYLVRRDYALSLDNIEHNERITRSDFKDAVWGVQIGAGIDLLFLTFDIGYEFGLEEFLNISSLDDLGFSNNTFFASLGWRIF